MVPLVIFNQKVHFLPKIVYFKVFLGITTLKVPFLKDSGHFPKILDYTTPIAVFVKIPYSAS